MQTKLGSIVSSLPSHASAQTSQVNKPGDNPELISLILVCSAIVLLTVICNNISKLIQPLLYSKSPNKVPCRNCQYFNSNYYIKCAVHPSNVMTDRAVDCKDYRSAKIHHT